MKKADRLTYEPVDYRNFTKHGRRGKCVSANNPILQQRNKKPWCNENLGYLTPEEAHQGYGLRVAYKKYDTCRFCEHYHQPQVGESWLSKNVTAAATYTDGSTADQTPAAIMDLTRASQKQKAASGENC